MTKENKTTQTTEPAIAVEPVLCAVRLPVYDCNGTACVVKIQPQNIKAWYAWDWNKWCKNGSRDIVEGKVISWTYCT